MQTGQPGNEVLTPCSENNILWGHGGFWIASVSQPHSQGGHRNGEVKKRPFWTPTSPISSFQWQLHLGATLSPLTEGKLRLERWGSVWHIWVAETKDDPSGLFNKQKGKGPIGSQDQNSTEQAWLLLGWRFHDSYQNGAQAFHLSCCCSFSGFGHCVRMALATLASSQPWGRSEAPSDWQ